MSCKDSGDIDVMPPADRNGYPSLPFVGVCNNCSIKCYVTANVLPDLGRIADQLVAQVDDVDDDADHQLNSGASDIE